jgi:hypothetical protein
MIILLNFGSSITTYMIVHTLCLGQKKLWDTKLWNDIEVKITQCLLALSSRLLTITHCLHTVTSYSLTLPLCLLVQSLCMLALSSRLLTIIPWLLEVTTCLVLSPWYLYGWMTVQCSVIKYFNMPGLHISFDISTLHRYNDVTIQNERCNQPQSKLKVSIMLIANLHITFWYQGAHVRSFREICRTLISCCLNRSPSVVSLCFNYAIN